MKLNKISAMMLLAAMGTSAFSQSIRDYATAGSTYSESFDTLAASGSPAWSNNPAFPVIVGWSIWQARTAGVSNVRDNTFNNTTAYVAGDGTGNTGAVYSFGTGTSTDRALGDIGSGTTGDVLMLLALKNTTGAAITSFTTNYAFEQWRNGGNASLASQKVVFDYKVLTGSTIGSENFADYVIGFTAPGAAYDAVSVVNSATAGAVNGNVAGLIPGLGGTITGINWLPGNLLVLRWWDDNHTGNDHGFGIDNFSFSTPAPPATISGFLTLSDTIGNSGTENIGWTLSNGTNTYNGTVTVADVATSSYLFNIPSGAPAGPYTLKFKGGTFLSKTINLTLSGASLSAQNATLKNGDIDQDGEVGPSDFDTVVAQFGGTGTADLDNDGEVGPSDFDTVVANFGIGDE